MNPSSAPTLPPLSPAQDPSRYAKFCTTTGQGAAPTGSIIFTGHGANTLEHFSFASNLARADFPSLRDGDIRVIQLASEMGMGHRVAGSYWGIEFPIGTSHPVPQEYEQRDKLWTLKAG